MDLLLKILGFVCLLFLLLMALVLFLISRLRRGLRQLSQMADEAQQNTTPARLHLIPTPSPAWRDPEGVAGRADPLGDLGFQEVGTFTTQELPGLFLRAFAHPAECAYAVVYEHPQAGVWLDLFSRYEDGTTLTYTTTVQGRDLDQRPGHGKVPAPELDSAALWRRFHAERPQRPLAPHPAEAFAATFEQSYAEAMDWRNARGYSEEEVRRVLEADGSEVSDADVEAVREQMNLQARAGLEESLRERFLRETPMSAAEWERCRERLVFIHDSLSLPELEEILDEWLDHDQWRPALAEAQSRSVPARSAFAALNEALPPPEQFRRLGEIHDALPADVYTAPETEDDES